MIKAIKAIFNKSEDLRGNVTAAQAMAYVGSRSDKWDQYEPISAKAYDDGEQIFWEVSAAITSIGEETETISWHVWAVPASPVEENLSIAGWSGVYGEW